MIDIYLSIGSNIADRAAYMEQALVQIAERIGAIKAKSHFYETSSWGFESASFLNSVVLLSTGLSPMKCFRQAQKIETAMGRQRSAGGYMDRVIDIDILSYGTRVIDLPELQIPHPRIAERKFVLAPWQEIAPEHMVEGLGLTVLNLYESCQDRGQCEQWDYV